ACERVYAGGTRRDRRLSFTGLHLRDRAHMQGRTTDDLHVVGPLPDRAYRCFADDDERLRQETIQRGAVSKPGLELLGLPLKFAVAERLHIFFKPVHLFGETLQAPEGLPFTNAHDPVENRHGLSSPRLITA